MPAPINRTMRIAQGTGLLALMGVLAAAAIAVSAVVLMHQFDPAHFGLWWGPHAFFFGTADATMHVRQADEDTLYLAALVMVPLCALMSRELLGLARARLTRTAASRRQSTTTK